MTPSDRTAMQSALESLQGLIDPVYNEDSDWFGNARDDARAAIAALQARLAASEAAEAYPHEPLVRLRDAEAALAAMQARAGAADAVIAALLAVAKLHEDVFNRPAFAAARTHLAASKQGAERP